MLRELFRVPGTDFAVYSYGLMLVIAILAAVWLAKALARRRGIDPELFVNAGLLALVSGVVGAAAEPCAGELAALYGCRAELGSATVDDGQHPEGGLTYYGGFLLATPVLIWYAIHKRVPVRVGMDIIAVPDGGARVWARRVPAQRVLLWAGVCNGAWRCDSPYYSDVYVEQVQKGEIEPPRELLVSEVGGQRLLKPDEAKGIQS